MADVVGSITIADVEAAAVMREIAPAASTPQDEHAESPPRHATGCPSWSPPARWRYPDTRRVLTSADGLWRPRSVRRIREPAGPTAPTASGSTSRGGTMPLPNLTPEQRQQALDKAAEVRRERAELKDQLKHGGATLDSVLDRAAADDVVGRMKTEAVLQSLPGVGKVRAQQIMAKLEIAETRRLRGLGSKQRKALLAEMTAGDEPAD